MNNASGSERFTRLNAEAFPLSFDVSEPQKGVRSKAFHWFHLDVSSKASRISPTHWQAKLQSEYWFLSQNQSTDSSHCLYHLRNHPSQNSHSSARYPPSSSDREWWCCLERSNSHNLSSSVWWSPFPRSLTLQSKKDVMITINTYKSFS